MVLYTYNACSEVANQIMGVAPQSRAEVDIARKAAILRVAGFKIITTYRFIVSNMTRWIAGISEKLFWMCFKSKISICESVGYARPRFPIKSVPPCHRALLNDETTQKRAKRPKNDHKTHKTTQNDPKTIQNDPKNKSSLTMLKPYTNLPLRTLIITQYCGK